MFYSLSVIIFQNRYCSIFLKILFVLIGLKSNMLNVRPCNTDYAHVDGLKPFASHRMSHP